MNYTTKTLPVATREFLLSDLDFYREASQLLMSLRCNRAAGAHKKQNNNNYILGMFTVNWLTHSAFVALANLRYIIKCP